MNGVDKEKSPDNMQIELFATSKGVQTINSPVKSKILSMLRKCELSFDQIVSMSGKAKSTVSVHLKKLVKDGIIDSRPDPTDARKKIFFINAEYLGGVSREAQIGDDIENYVSSYVLSDGDPFEFFRLMFKTIRVGLISQGVNIDPILHEAGIKVGKALYERVYSSDINKFLQNIAQFWETHYLGSVEVKSMEPLTISVSECYECRHLPYLGHPACAFDAGILKALFSSYYNDQRTVDETKCYAMGDKYCCFVIEKKE
ncbi:MAG: ArsR family transcriptional regulator [Methanobacterium sp.]|uniref:V4R domain-containing protein n=1 Tax=Methanobacterium sp. TaxID=2164 RepID=UPI003D64EA9D|nr:ArsR family transcriptional regulator [Methanobacterium sp.]